MSNVSIAALLADASGDVLFADRSGAYLITEIVGGGLPTLPPYGQTDFLAALQGLMPRGRAWPRDATAVQTLLLSAFAATLARVAASAAGLLPDIFPATTVNLLPEWEETLGLPDPCAGPAPTIVQRQQQVAAQFAAGGGQSVAYFTDLAARLGYAITITEFTGDLAHHWQVNAPAATEFYFHAGVNRAGDPLSTDPNAVLECVFNRLKPGHTTVSFVYGGL